MILGFLRTSRDLDVGMLTGDERLKPKLDRFMADRRTHLRAGFFEKAAIIAAIAAFLVICWLVWEALRPPAL